MILPQAVHWSYGAANDHLAPCQSRRKLQNNEIQVLPVGVLAHNIDLQHLYVACWGHSSESWVSLSFLPMGGHWLWR